MKALHCLSLALLLGSVVILGCGQQPAKQTGVNKSGQNPEEKAQAEIKAALAKLSAEDRKLAKAQKMCPIGGEALGSMGKPYKVMVKDEPVFLCCKGCKTQALANPDETLAKVKKLKAKHQQ